MKLRTSLSLNDLEKLIDKVDGMKKDMNKLDKNIVNKLAEYTLEEIQKNYANTPFKDGNEDVSFFITGTENNRKVGAMGSQVLYNEFGTGTEGMANKHPLKNNFGLNAYNSGKTIRKNTRLSSKATEEGIPQGEFYWTYKDSQGNKIYTDGIPAGKQVFDATQKLKKKKKEIIKKEVGDLLSKH